MKVTLIGTGYVGLTTGVCLSYLGHDVTCLDLDAAKIAMLQSGRTPIYEPHLDDLMALSGDRLRFTTDAAEALAGAEVVFVAVGTPPLPDGRPDLSYVRSAAQSVGRYATGEFVVVVNKSTVPIGSGNWVESIIRETTGNPRDPRFAVASNPEFLREGSALLDSLYPDRIVVGADQPAALDRMYHLYRPLVEQNFPAPAFLPRPDSVSAVPLISTDLASAELIKYAANAFLALKISFINEIGELAECVGADVMQVAKGIGLDARIGHRFLQPGIGWGGSCFGKDTSALISTAEEYRLEMKIVEAARTVNARQRERAVRKLMSELKILKGREVGILGLAFKPFTDDLRDSPALHLAALLAERGVRVKVHDPVAMERAKREVKGIDLYYCDTAEQCADNSHAVLVVTDWPQYRDLDWKALASTMANPLVLDCRNYLDRTRMESAGLRYVRLHQDEGSRISRAALAGAVPAAE